MKSNYFGVWNSIVSFGVGFNENIIKLNQNKHKGSSMSTRNPTGNWNLSKRDFKEYWNEK